ncbi:MAG TPA: argininosuccinate lyase [bacterium]|nr:argininosuccinate lyase [bacterium]
MPESRRGSQDDSATARMWGGRFRGELDPTIAAFTTSLPFDHRLYRADILGSIAHATMLGRSGIVPVADADRLVEGLREILAEVDAGLLKIRGAEDIHSFVESALRTRIGDAARRLHTARSRNDQVATDLRFYLKSEIVKIIGRTVALQQVLLAMAEAHPSIIIPGYTHLQRAQPVLLAHHLLAYVWMLDRDVGRFRDAFARTDVLPLGAAALAGTSYPIDPLLVAELLGFSRIADNSLDATSDRDFAVEFVGAASLLMIHLSKLAGEIVLWATAEFGFVELLDTISSGSSIMPQKKNPDAAEIVRGKASRVVGDLVTLLAVQRGLPLAYNSDLQEDKEAVFDVVDTANASLQVMGLVLNGIRINVDGIAARLRGGFMGATEIADALARRGLPFRDAHELVGRIVLYAQERGRELWELSPEEYREFSPLLDADVAQATTPAGAVASKRSHGGTAPERVQEQVQAVREAITENLSWLAALPAAPVERDAAAPGAPPKRRAPER